MDSLYDVLNVRLNVRNQFLLCSEGEVQQESYKCSREKSKGNEELCLKTHCYV